MADLTLARELPAGLDFELDPAFGAPSAELPASLDFDLCRELPAGLDFDLAVAAGGAEPEATVIEGTLKAAVVVTARMAGQTGVSGTLAGVVPSPRAAFAGEWDANVWRGTVARCAAPEEPASRRPVAIGVSWQQNTRKTPEKELPWAGGTAAAPDVTAPLGRLDPRRPARVSGWEDAAPMSSHRGAGYVNCWPRNTARSGTFAAGTPLQLVRAGCFIRCWPRPVRRDSRYQAVTGTWLELGNLFQAARRSGAGVCNPWQAARRPEFVWPLPMVSDPRPEPFVGSPDLELLCRLPEPLWGGVVFDLGNAEICRQALPVGWTPPAWQPRKVIIVVHHDLYIKLLSDGSIIEADAIELSLDRDAWGWNWGAELRERRADLLTTQHQVEIGIDGFTWRGIVETFSGSREHGRQGWRLGGRSPAALFSTPYTAPRSRSESSDRNARQLAEDEIAGSGWSFDWRIIDWLVPGGTFGYGNATPIAAVKMIAGAVDGLVQAHASDQVLIVAPRYAVPPWELNAADAAALAATIPLDLVLEEAITWRPETLLRGVWVSGRSAGVRCRVYRSGSDGAPYGEMIVDPLITEVAAARERGRGRLAASGKRREVTLTLPLTAEIGALKPGDLIEVADAPAWRGYLDRVRITANRVTVRQALTIEHVTEY